MRKSARKRIGRPKVRNPKSERFLLCLTKGQLAAIRKAAKSAGVPANEWAREILQAAAGAAGESASGV